jgi:hypothetical protein
LLQKRRPELAAFFVSGWYYCDFSRVAKIGDLWHGEQTAKVAIKSLFF